MDSSSDHDGGLRALFEREHRHVPDEPFVAATVRRIAAERRRRSWLKRASLAALLLLVVGASPWLVAGSALLSATLGQLFNYAAELLSTPVGMCLGALGVIAVLVLNRKLIL
jgi:hypothetical protein